MPQEIISSFRRAYQGPIETNRTVADSTARDAISSLVRWEGMIVYVVADGLTYTLVGGIDNADWELFGGVPDAPSDGSEYVRKDGAWSIATGEASPTSIVGISGTKSEFNTELTDGTFLFVGDAPTSHTHVEADITDLGSYLASTDIDTLAELNAIVGDATLIDTADSRLSDARIPTAHTHVVADITDFDGNDYVAVIGDTMTGDLTIASAGKLVLSNDGEFGSDGTNIVQNKLTAGSFHWQNAGSSVMTFTPSTSNLTIDGGASSAGALYLSGDVGNTNKHRIRYNGNQLFAIRDDVAGVDRISISLAGAVNIPNALTLAGDLIIDNGVTEENIQVENGFVTAKKDGSTWRTLLGNSGTTRNYLVGGSSVDSVNTLDTYLRIRSIADGDLTFQENSLAHKIWHEGNDGIGSGLDADTLRTFPPTTSDSANTIALRDSQGDIYASDFRADELVLAGLGGVNQNPLRLYGTGAGTANIVYTSFYESDLATRQGYIGFPSSGHSNMVLFNDANNTYINLLGTGGVNGLQYYDGSIRTVWHSGNLTISDTAYNATTWNGNTDGATKNAIRDKFETTWNQTNMPIPTTEVYSEGSQTSGLILSGSTSGTYTIGIQETRWCRIGQMTMFTIALTNINSAIPVGNLTLSVDGVSGFPTPYIAGRFSFMVVTNGIGNAGYNFFCKNNNNNDWVFYRQADLDNLNDDQPVVNANFTGVEDIVISGSFLSNSPN